MNAQIEKLTKQQATQQTIYNRDLTKYRDSNAQKNLQMAKMLEIVNAFTHRVITCES